MLVMQFADLEFERVGATSIIPSLMDEMVVEEVEAKTDKAPQVTQGEDRHFRPAKASPFSRSARSSEDSSGETMTAMSRSLSGVASEGRLGGFLMRECPEREGQKHAHTLSTPIAYEDCRG